MRTDRRRVMRQGSRRALPGAPGQNAVCIAYTLLPTSRLPWRKKRLLLHLV